MSHEFDANFAPPAERAFAEAKDAFRSAMMGCEPFADLVMAHISDPRQQTPTALPDFGCEPWRYTDHTGQPDGYGVRLSFSATGQDEGLRSTVSTYDYIKIARITNTKELFAGVLVKDIKDRQPDVTDTEDRAQAIVSSYLTAFNNFVRTEIPGDELTVDGMSGAFGLASDINNSTHLAE
jgi:hypothetical protein